MPQEIIHKHPKLHQYGLSEAEIARHLGYKSAESFYKSSAKHRIIKGIEAIMTIMERRITSGRVKLG